MRRANPYLVERAFVVLVMLLSVAGFWNIYFGRGADPGGHHHLHVVVIFAWLSLLLAQLVLLANGSNASHRTVGLGVLAMGPMLVASTALLAVHSAHKGLVSGQGDFLIVQNVMGTLELAAIIVAAFVMRRRRKLHGAFLLGTAIFFMGIALFFALISFVPMFRIEGPETFYRFQTAGVAGRYACLAVGLAFFLRDWRNGWPLLLVSSFFSVNEAINAALARNDLLQPLTAFVGSLDQALVFAGVFVAMAAMLGATGVLAGRQRPVALPAG